MVQDFVYSNRVHYLTSKSRIILPPSVVSLFNTFFLLYRRRLFCRIFSTLTTLHLISPRLMYISYKRASERTLRSLSDRVS